MQSHGPPSLGRGNDVVGPRLQFCRFYDVHDVTLKIDSQRVALDFADVY